jgi:Fe-S cluster assembly protein SufD
LNFYHFGERIVSYLNGITIMERSSTSTIILVQHATQIVKVIKITKESFLTVRPVFSTGKFTCKRGPKTTHSKKNNILLSDKATINAKPQLEIFADDVKCSHGCTIGTIRRKRYVLYASTWNSEKRKALLMYAFSNAIKTSKYLN